MAKYIDADKVIDAIDEVVELRPSELRQIKNAIADLPASDAEKVRHGGWQVSDNEISGTLVRCSVCHMKHTRNVTLEEFAMFFHYCPNCGAKMDGGAGNG